jgi:filamentous hemagglutinin family protein
MVRSSSRRRSKAPWPLFAFALVPLLPVSAHAASLPTGGRVVAGSASIGAPSGGALTIDQTSKDAIINWSGFSIGSGNSVTFDNGSGATLNRVTGPGVSSLNGVLNATGSVFVINANGVVVGRSGVIKTGGSFVASTLDVQRGAMRRIDESLVVAIAAGRVIKDDSAEVGLYTQIGGDEERMHKRLHILDPKKGPIEISEVSTLVRTLKDPKKFTRYYFEYEADRETARARGRR